jgi:hypothetical protein
MSEMISGERAKLICQHLRIYWRCRVCKEVRSAVAAQKEKADATDFWSVKCTECGVDSGMPCAGSTVMIHTERAIAAIRNQPEGSDGQGGENDG